MSSTGSETNHVVPPGGERLEHALRRIFLRIFIVFVAVTALASTGILTRLFGRISQASAWNLPGEVLRLAGGGKNLAESLTRLRPLLDAAVPHASFRIIETGDHRLRADPFSSERSRLADVFSTLELPEQPVWCDYPSMPLGRELCIVRPIPGRDERRLLDVSIDSPFVRELTRPYGLPALFAFVLISSVVLILGYSAVLRRNLRRQVDGIFALIRSYRDGASVPPVPRGNDEFSAVARAAHRLLTTVAERSAKLRVREQARRELFANIIHDLRAPITAARGIVEMISERCSSRGTEASEREWTALTRSCDAHERLARSLQALSDPILEGEVAVRSAVELSEFLRELVLSLSGRAEDHGIDLRFHTTRDPLRVAVDGGLIERAVINLVENAFRHTPRGGCVRVELDAIADEVIISVADSGEGIAEALQPFIFDRLFRRRGGGADSGGAGLGLAIVKRVATLHGGSCDVRSRRGEGAAFRLAIPSGVSREDPAEAPVDRRERLSKWFVAGSADAATVLLSRIVVVCPLVGSLTLLHQWRSTVTALMLSALISAGLLILRPRLRVFALEDGWRAVITVLAIGVGTAVAEYALLPIRAKEHGAWISAALGILCGVAASRLGSTPSAALFLVPVTGVFMVNATDPMARPEVRLFVFGVTAVCSYVPEYLWASGAQERFARKILVALNLNLMLLLALELFGCYRIAYRIIERTEQRELSALASKLPSIVPSSAGDPTFFAVRKSLADIRLLNPLVDFHLLLPGGDVMTLDGERSQPVPLDEAGPPVVGATSRFLRPEDMKHIVEGTVGALGPANDGVLVSVSTAERLRMFMRRGTEYEFTYGTGLVLFIVYSAAGAIGSPALRRIQQSTLALLSTVKRLELHSDAPEVRDRSLGFVELDAIAHAVSRLALDANAQRVQLDASDDAVRALVADLAMLEDSRNRAWRACMADRSRGGVARLAALVAAEERFLDGMFDLVRYADSTRDLERCQLDLREAIDETLLSEGRSFAERGITVRLEAPNEMPIVSDRRLVERIVLSVLGMVETALPNGGEAVLRCNRAGSMVCLELITAYEGTSDDPRFRLDLALLERRGAVLGGTVSVGREGESVVLQVTIRDDGHESAESP